MALGYEQALHSRFADKQLRQKLMRLIRVTFHMSVHGISPISHIWKIKHDFFDSTTTFITLTAPILVLQPRGQLGYLNSNLMLRWHGHFKFNVAVWLLVSDLENEHDTIQYPLSSTATPTATDQAGMVISLASWTVPQCVTAQRNSWCLTLDGLDDNVESRQTIWSEKFFIRCWELRSHVDTANCCLIKLTTKASDWGRRSEEGSRSDGFVERCAVGSMNSTCRRARQTLGGIRPRLTYTFTLQQGVATTGGQLTPQPRPGPFFSQRERVG